MYYIHMQYIYVTMAGFRWSSLFNVTDVIISDHPRNMNLTIKSVCAATIISALRYLIQSSISL